MPAQIHGEVPPGTEVMTERRSSIDYRYVELPRGAEVRLTTGDAAALKAIHQFLRFQIEEHRTGDSPEISTGEVERRR